VPPRRQFLRTADYGGAYTNVSDYFRRLRTIFQLTTNGTVSYRSSCYTNGAHPSGGLVLGQDGSFYGTTRVAAEASAALSGLRHGIQNDSRRKVHQLYLFNGSSDAAFIYAGGAGRMAIYIGGIQRGQG